MNLVRILCVYAVDIIEQILCKLCRIVSVAQRLHGRLVGAGRILQRRVLKVRIQRIVGIGHRQLVTLIGQTL